jgi:hypothetical protein
MKIQLLAVSILLATVLSSEVAIAAQKTKGPASSAVKGQTLYTQFSLFHEDLAHRTTNYRKGILVPVNTEVTFVKSNKKEIVVMLRSGEKLTVANIPEFSGEDIDGIFSRTFSEEKIDLTKFTAEEQKGIAAGEPAVGMTKAAVVVATGYPPKHKTPSLDSSDWRYWRNRFATFIVHFDSGVVSAIKK